MINKEGYATIAIVVLALAVINILYIRYFADYKWPGYILQAGSVFLLFLGILCHFSRVKLYFFAFLRVRMQSSQQVAYTEVREQHKQESDDGKHVVKNL